jgi:hypothetical protein
MGKKSKNKKTNTKPISAAVNSTNSKELKDILPEFEGDISKPEGQLHENEVQKRIDIAAALETGRKEVIFVVTRLEFMKVEVLEANNCQSPVMAIISDTFINHMHIAPIAVVSWTPHDISVLCSGLKNPWGSLTQCDCCSHPHRLSAYNCCCSPPYFLDNYRPNLLHLDQS